jgi:hypothetical protein
MGYLCNQHNFHKLPASSALNDGPGPGIVNLITADQAGTPDLKDPMLFPTNPCSRAMQCHKVVKGGPDPNDPSIKNYIWA